MHRPASRHQVHPATLLVFNGSRSMSRSTHIQVAATTSDNQSSLRDLIRKIVREDLLKFRTPVTDTPMESFAEVVHEKIRPAFSTADPTHDQRPMSYAAALHRPPPVAPSCHQPSAAVPWSAPQEQTPRRPAVLPPYEIPPY
ncbi:hypothetical protein HPB51_008067 [Rhipicephalus microplus]|uniref:Uncharacterized protein n=1 Tax=Rhipicephalus microplus TaxID=6941 RepID=A0A9J6EFN6_RHIMP|nr:hypothetical protein HPB51_008067 [Rhipicephalus microplus]